MAYRFEPGESVGTAVTRIVDEEVEAALESLARVHVDADPAAVHDVRKRTKKLRALAVLVRKGAGAGPASDFRSLASDAARSLATARDAQVLVDTVRAVGEHAAAMGEDPAVLAPAMAHAGKLAAAAGGEMARELPDAAHHASWLLTAARSQVASWELADDFATVADGLVGTYAQSRKRWRNLVGSGPTLPVEPAHAWRRRVKQRWYHLRLLERLAPDVLAAEAALLDEAGDVLGRDHDLALLVERLADDPDRWGGAGVAAQVAHLASDLRATLATRALVIGRQLHGDRPGAFRERFGTWWHQVS
jgi:CHAD domain-containing protein